MDLPGKGEGPFLFYKAGEVMYKAEKVKEVELIADKVKSAKVVVFADFQSLRASDVIKLRQGTKAQQGEVRVTKNTIINLAFKKLGYSQPDLRGFTGIIFGYEDMISPVKFLVDFGRDKPTIFRIKGGFVEGNLLDAMAMFSLSTLPGREVLLGQVTFMMKSPISNFLNVLNGPLRGLIQALKMIEQQKGGLN